jgi:hypothetical protein
MPLCFCVEVIESLFDKSPIRDRLCWNRLTTVAEGRRNATLREIDHRRAILGETLRRSAQEIEADEFKVIEGKNAA